MARPSPLSHPLYMIYPCMGGHDVLRSEAGDVPTTFSDQVDRARRAVVHQKGDSCTASDASTDWMAGRVAASTTLQLGVEDFVGILVADTQTRALLMQEVGAKLGWGRDHTPSPSVTPRPAARQKPAPPR